MPTLDRVATPKGRAMSVYLADPDAADKACAAAHDQGFQLLFIVGHQRAKDVCAARRGRPTVGVLARARLQDQRSRTIDVAAQPEMSSNFDHAQPIGRRRAGGAASAS